MSKTKTPILLDPANYVHVKEHPAEGWHFDHDRRIILKLVHRRRKSPQVKGTITMMLLQLCKRSKYSSDDTSCAPDERIVFLYSKDNLIAATTKTI
ncbi:hypothetical protein HOLleu_21361 [Holothuria leucospilota]|uniref:Uncharacterized protein n=1 Tax=Holothuria leucospilota TaxID=206669 RepID=A0A9Q1H3Y6_HOLLE|nr:hypothetical protein HOLleu_21361 [Holothuria leucospilota]